MPKHKTQQGKLFRSTPPRVISGVLRAVTGVFSKMTARRGLAVFVSGSVNSGRGSSLGASRGIYIRARLSAGVAVLVLAIASSIMIVHPAPTNAATSDTVNFQAK